MHPDTGAESGRTPLGLASAGGYGLIVRALLRYEADVNLTSQGRKTPLYLAVQHRRHDVVEFLLGGPVTRIPEDQLAGGSPALTVVVDAPDSARQTPLHMAASAGDERLIELLIYRGANVEARSAKRQTPLHFAVQAERHQAARLLIFKYCASLTALDQDDKHPMYYAIDRLDTEMVQALLVPDPGDLKDGDIGSGYSSEFKRRDLSIAVEKSALQIFDLLRTTYHDALQSLQAIDGPSGSLLHIAARGSNAKMVEKLLRYESSPDLLGDDGETPLHIAAAFGNVDATKALLIAKADPASIDNEGKTPLLLACVSDENAPKICEALLKGGASVNDVGKFGRTPLFQASYHRQGEVVRVLLDPRRGAEVNWKNEDLWSSLHAAADSPDICHQLILAGADINCRTMDGWTPLHLACFWGAPEAVKCLLDHGAEANLRGNSGVTPLHVAVEANRQSVVDVMISHERTSPGSEDATQQLENAVHIRAPTNEGLTCLDLAVILGSFDMLETLLKATDWDYQDLVRPFWALFKRDMIDCLKPLINQDGRLLDSSCPNGSDNSPQTTLEGRDVALRLFHLAIYGCDGGLWNTLVKLDAKSKVTNNTYDKDGWTLEHYIHTAPARADFIQDSDRVPARGCTKSPSTILLPSSWVGESEYGARMGDMEIRGNGLEVDFESE